MEWCHWWYHDNTSDTGISIKWPKGFVAHCFNCLDLMNRVVLLTVALVSHGSDSKVNSVKGLKKSHFILFWISWTNKISGVIDDAIRVMSCQNWYLMTKRSCCTSFINLDLANKTLPLTMWSMSCDAPTDANSITWPEKSFHTLFQLSSI